MREGYGTCSVIRSFVHSFCPPSCRDHRSLLKLGKGMNRLSTTMACNLAENVLRQGNNTLSGSVFVVCQLMVLRAMPRLAGARNLQEEVISATGLF